MHNVGTMTDDNYDLIFQANDLGVVVVKFWAEWCQPCKKVGVALETLAKEMSDKQIAFFSVNIDSNPKIANLHAIMSVPTIITFKRGEIRSVLVGAKSLGLYRSVFNGILDNE